MIETPYVHVGGERRMITEQELCGFGRMSLVFPVRHHSEEPKEYNDSVVEIGKLVPYLHSFQAPYDATFAATSTALAARTGVVPNPTVTYARASRYRDRDDPMRVRGILDTKFAHDSNQGIDEAIQELIGYLSILKTPDDDRSMVKTVIDVNHRPREIKSVDVVTYDIDEKIPNKVLKGAATKLRRVGTEMAAIVGTSRKPLKEYKQDPFIGIESRVDQIVDSEAPINTVILGIREAPQMVEWTRERGLDWTIVATGGSLQMDEAHMREHPAGLPFSEVDVDGFVVTVGTGVWEGRNTEQRLELALKHAQIIGS